MIRAVCLNPGAQREYIDAFLCTGADRSDIDRIDNFGDSAKWYARAITGFQQTQEQHEVERNVRNFLINYRQAPPAEKEKMKAIWLKAGLGPFPEPA